MRTSLRLPPEMKIGLLIIMAALWSCGCAKIGDPQPPEIRIPEPATDLAVRQLSDFAVLTVTKPERNTNGSAVNTLKRLDVLRLSAEDAGNAAGALPQEQFIKLATCIFSVSASRFTEYLSDKTFVFQDRFTIEKKEMYSHTFWYAVLFVNNKNQSAGLGNRVSITPVPIPPPPEGLTVEGTQDCIQLKWTAPAGNMDGSRPPRIAGYNIYRTEEPGKFPSLPINPNPVQISEFQDPDFRFGTTYYYVLATVGSLQRPYPESLPSKAVAIAAKDIFSPLPPGSLNAIFQGAEVILLWTSSPSADVAGYRIYRQEKGSSDRQLIQTELIRGLNFRDSRVDPGKKYEYEILAVDTYGNVSLPAKTESE
jgi:hypothetical protein